MPALEVMDLIHDAVLWRKTGSDANNVSVFSSAEDVRVRWVNKRREITDPKGNVVATDAQVTTCETLAVGDLLWKGCIDDVAGTGSEPVPEGGLMQIVTRSEAQDVKGRATRREYGLMRYTDSPVVE